jgi:hypothetical protein
MIYLFERDADLEVVFDGTPHRKFTELLGDRSTHEHHHWDGIRLYFAELHSEALHHAEIKAKRAYHKVNAQFWRGGGSGGIMQRAKRAVPIRHGQADQVSQTAPPGSGDARDESEHLSPTPPPQE